MAAKFFSLASLAVIGIIIADIWIHPTGTQASGQAILGIETPVIGGLLGAAPVAAAA